MGSIGGSIVALEVGGPGAIGWMWVASILGMALIYADVLFAVRLRRGRRAWAPDGYAGEGRPCSRVAEGGSAQPLSGQTLALTCSGSCSWCSRSRGLDAPDPAEQRAARGLRGRPLVRGRLLGGGRRDRDARAQAAQLRRRARAGRDHALRDRAGLGARQGAAQRGRSLRRDHLEHVDRARGHPRRRRGGPVGRPPSRVPARDDGDRGRARQRRLHARGRRRQSPRAGRERSDAGPAGQRHRGPHPDRPGGPDLDMDRPAHR